MKRVFEAFWNAATWAVAVAIFLYIIWFALRSHSHMWRLVAASYGGKPASAAIARKLETIVIATRGLRTPNPFGKLRYRNYAGLILTVHDDGLSLSLIPLFNIWYPRLFLPFDEMELKQTDWALWPEPFAARMQRLHEIDIILGRDSVRWIREHTNQPPFGLDV